MNNTLEKAKAVLLARKERSNQKIRKLSKKTLKIKLISFKTKRCLPCQISKFNFPVLICFTCET